MASVNAVSEAKPFSSKARSVFQSGVASIPAGNRWMGNPGIGAPSGSTRTPVESARPPTVNARSCRGASRSRLKRSLVRADSRSAGVELEAARPLEVQLEGAVLRRVGVRCRCKPSDAARMGCFPLSVGHASARRRTGDGEHARRTVERRECPHRNTLHPLLESGRVDAQDQNGVGHLERPRNPDLGSHAPLIVAADALQQPCLRAPGLCGPAERQLHLDAGHRAGGVVRPRDRGDLDRNRSTFRSLLRARDRAPLS